MYSFKQLQKGYENLYGEMKIRPSWVSRIDEKAMLIISNKYLYIDISKQTGVPWQVIGVIHLMEADCDFNCHLHNGDSLRHRTVNEPKNRPLTGDGPFNFNDSAIDALKYDGFVGEFDWTPEFIAYMLEKYNGMGYFTHNINSPYLWSGTNLYISGKFVADGQFDAGAVSRQVGAMPVYYRIMELDIPKQELVNSSRKLQTLRNLRNSVVATTGTYITADNLQVIPTWLSKLEHLALSKTSLLLFGAAVSLWVILKIVENMSMQDYVKGNYIPSKMDTSVAPDKLMMEPPVQEYKYREKAVATSEPNVTPSLSSFIEPVANV